MKVRVCEQQKVGQGDTETKGKRGVRVVHEMSFVLLNKVDFI